MTAGGQGGEASQPDGRGGRGGHAYVGYDLARPGAAARPAHMRWPYYEPITEAGRGGDAPDTPQYKVRRLIVEQIKKKYFAQHGLPFDEVWWDREIVPLTWINEQIGADGHTFGEQPSLMTSTSSPSANSCYRMRRLSRGRRNVSFWTNDFFAFPS